MQGTSTGIIMGIFAGIQRVHPQSSKEGRQGRRLTPMHIEKGFA